MNLNRKINQAYNTLYYLQQINLSSTYTKYNTNINVIGMINLNNIQILITINNGHIIMLFIYIRLYKIWL